MNLSFNSFDGKQRLFFAFLVYSFISFIISVTSFILFREIEKIDKTAQLISTLRNEIQVYIRLDNDFLLYEVNTPTYFLAGESDYIKTQERVVATIKHLADSIILSERAFAFQLEDDIELYKELFNEKEILKKAIFNNIYLIGYRDFGYTGKMRKAVHIIEKTPNIDLVSLLMLRRHEKDYFLRNDQGYLVLHQKERDNFKNKVIMSTALKQETKDEILKQLYIYTSVFEKIVTLEGYTGYKNNKGLISQMRHKTKGIDDLILKITTTAEKTKNDIIYKIQTVIVVMVTLSVILLLLLAVSFSFVVKSGKL